MKKINPYYIKENLVKVEEVRYLDQNYQPMSYENFMKTYEPNQEVSIITEEEFQDKSLYGPQYGPGNTQSRETATVATAIGMTALAVFCPPAAVAVGGGMVGSGAFMVGLAKAKEISDGCGGEEIDEMNSLGKQFIGIGATGAIGGGAGLEAHAAKKTCALGLCKK